MQGDIEKLLAALPRRPFRQPTSQTEPTLREWTWPVLRDYNGFTGIERVWGWQLNNWMRDAGMMQYAKKCDVCWSMWKCQYHSENYYASPHSPVVCGSCHKIIHQRSTSGSDTFLQLVAKYGDGTKWFEFLGTAPLDVAGYLRDVYGDIVKDFAISPLLTDLPRTPTKLYAQLYGGGMRHRSRR